MVKNVFNFPYNPGDFSSTLPIIVPISYQRQYTVFGNEIRSQRILRNGCSDLALTLEELRKEGLEIQKDAGNGRYPLRSTHKRLNEIYVRLFEKDGIVYRSVTWISESTSPFITQSANYYRNIIIERLNI